MKYSNNLETHPKKPKTDLSFYNTLTRSQENFVPIDAKQVKLYVCGPTVYDFIHIGNARPAVIFDTLFRLLRHVFGSEAVLYARNITDIDDKIIQRAADLGEPVAAITRRYTMAYQQHTAALGCLSPTIQPIATDHIPDMIVMIETLIAKGFAYQAEGHVLFNVSQMETYGRLSGHSREDLIAGSRVEIAPYKKDPSDFVLWKPSTMAQPGWDSPFGFGRPGWHLECSCMIKKHLGETIDIHGGGQDLIFPHHENEIAQSCCANDTDFVGTWLHNGYLTSDGVKMSKSLGNFYTVKELLERFPGEALRLSLMVAHYRQPIDFSFRVVEDQKKRLDRWYRLIAGVEASDIPHAIIEALADDLNTPKALAVMDDLAKPETASSLKAAGQFLGFFQTEPDVWFQSGKQDMPSQEIEKLIAERAQAKKNKDFSGADAIRGRLLKKGIVLEDGPDGTLWRVE